MPDRNPSPKSRFLSDKRAVESHNEIFSRPEAGLSLSMALLQYQHYLCSQQPIPGDLTGAAFNHNRLRGAQEFVGVLLNLGETTLPPTTEKTGNLSHG